MLRPLGDRVLVELPDPKAEKETAFGIIIPDSVDSKKKDENIISTVLAIGPSVVSKIKVGDKVMLASFGYDEIKDETTTYIIVNESNILAIIN